MRVMIVSINGALIVVYLLVFVPLWGGYLRCDNKPQRGHLSKYFDALRRGSEEKAKIRTVNLLMPSDYAGLTAFLNGGQGRDPQALSPYADYFRSLTAILPAPFSADAYAMLGFCRFHQGDQDDALKDYARSLEINPVFLTTYHNLAVLYFRRGDYAKTSELVSRMMALDLQLTWQVIATSKIYIDILKDVRIDPSQEIKAAYSDAMRLLVVSLYRQGRFPEAANAALYAVKSGLAPAEVFQYYAVLSVADQQQRLQADSVALDPVFVAGDINVRLF